MDVATSSKLRTTQLGLSRHETIAFQSPERHQCSPRFTLQSYIMTFLPQPLKRHTRRSVKLCKSFVLKSMSHQRAAVVIHGILTKDKMIRTWDASKISSSRVRRTSARQ